MVKCADCGFLSLRNRVSWDLVPAHMQFRENGLVGASLEQTISPFPICFAMKLKFQQVIESIEPEKPFRPEKTMSVIHEERHCFQFVKWEVGYTPKEHDELIRRAESEKRRDEQAEIARMEQEYLMDKQQKFQIEVLETQRLWQLQQTQQVEQRAKAREISRLRWEIVVFGVLVTAALIGGQIGAAFIARGS